MTKYNQTFKQQAIDFYLKNHLDVSLTKKQFQLSDTTLRRWITQYQHSGNAGLALLPGKRIYSAEFKYQVILAVQKGDFSARQATIHFGISNSGLISQWLKAFEKDGINGLHPKPKGRPTMSPKKPKYAKMPPPPKTEEDRLRLRILELEAEVAFLKKLDEVIREEEAEPAAIIQRLRGTFPLNILLSLANLSRSVFFYHLKPKADKNTALKAEIRRIKAENPAYGYRRVSALLKGVNHKRVQHLIQQMGLQVKGKKARKYAAYRGEIGNIAPNRLQRDFTTTRPNEKWLTDITEIKAKDGSKCYVSPILDCFNSEIISVAISRSPNWQQVKVMLQQAVEKLPKEAKPILHSDQGWQYQMCAYQRILQENGIVQSMSRKGNCLDNAMMESFFGRMKTECIYGKHFDNAEEVAQAVREYIRYYNEERIQLKLNGLSPIQYRTQTMC
ncbi:MULTISPECIES: IS3 family transposase [Rodentibacter]|uniref:IS3 family transposase n=1 Tax=Rodentibacter TaxID=1960084 RepID=UPI001CFE7E88|nr:IS3 family transposase [Rodentibacter sp. JRC1]